MKIPPKDIESFLINIPNSIKAILLYGPDHGLVKIRTKFLNKTRELVYQCNYDQIKNNPNILLDQFNSISLFASNPNNEKLILVECNNSNLNNEFCAFLKEIPYKGLLVFYAGELGTDSNLRKLFENNNNLASIACYQDDSLNILKLIQQCFKERQITFANNVPSLLLNYLPSGDRMLVLNELEKISLFVANKKHFSIEDLENYLELQGEVSFDKLCYQISLKQVKNISYLLEKLQNEGHNLVAIIRMVIRHFFRLYQVKQLIEKGQDEQQALATLSPPVFFKQINDFKQSLKLWSKEDLSNFLTKLTETELFIKQSSITAQVTVQNLLINTLIKS